MNPRNYNKLYVHPNREEGSEKLWLGYQQDTRDIVFKKDGETYFHVPYFTNPVRLADSTLIADGATGGSFPAASDRIFKNKKNFGNVTANGDPSDIADGLWFCSWLYKRPDGVLQWIDRFYNPGSFRFSIAIEQLTQGYTYSENNPVFRDVPSNMVFEPGVMYRYFHTGEKTAQELVKTLGGLSEDKLALNLDNWGTEFVDSSKNKLSLTISSNASRSELYPSQPNKDRVPFPTISYNHNKSLDIVLPYNPVYTFTEEFSLAFWAESSSWQDSQSTMLAGNFTSQGGFGLFIQSLSTFPFFVIPETTYGHLLYINEGIGAVLDKSTQLVPLQSVSTQFVAIDLDSNVIACNNDGTGLITRYDNAGRILNTTRNADTQFSFATVDERPHQLLCGRNNTVVLISTRAIYTFDKDLNLINTLEWGVTTTTVAAYRYDTITQEEELILKNNVRDLKFIENQEWFISENGDGLYRQSEEDTEPVLFAIFSTAEGGAKTFTIDPYNRIWVLHGNNNLSVFNSLSEPLEDPLFVADVGLNKSREENETRNISFICSYNRASQSREWQCLVFYSDEPTLYVLDLTGVLLQNTPLNAYFNFSTLTLLNQDSSRFRFRTKNDFTGYEHKRVFGKLSPYNNESQLVLRTSLKDKTRSDLTFRFFKTQTSIGDWDKNSWQHFVVSLKNRAFVVYVNGVKLLELPYSGQYELSYELQPQFFIGTPVGSQSGLNRELSYTSNIFNGLIQDVKIYNYSLEVEKLDVFLRASVPAQDLYWSLPVPYIQYLEQVERMFKHKLPGSKASLYSLKISGASLYSQETKAVMEQQIKEIARTLNPSYADLLEVRWVD